MFTRRQYKILELLLNNVQGITGVKIAECLNVSSRTVRNEIGEMNRIWTEGTIIKASKRKGYFIEEEDRNTVRKFLLENNNKYMDETDTYRGFVILGMALEKGTVNLYDICDELSLSETAIYKEVVKFQKDLDATYQSKMLHMTADTIWVEENEKAIRQTLFRIIKNETSQGTKTYQYLLQAFLYQSFDKNEFDWMVKLIKDYFDRWQIQISDANLYMITSAVYVTMVRNYQNHLLLTTTEHKKEELGVLRFFEYLKEQGFELNDADLEVIGELLYGFQMTSEFSDEEADDGLSSLILEEFCDEVMEKYQLDLWQSNDFYNNMLTHMKYMLRRMETGYTVKNPMLSDIKKQYPLAYEVSMLLVPIIYRYKNCYIQDDELCYISIFVEHFLEKVNQKLKAVVIGSTRFSVNAVIHNWLEKNFHNQIEVAATLPMHKLGQYLEENQVDLIISTVDSFFHPEIETFMIEGLPDTYTQRTLNALIYKIRKNYRFRKLIKEVFHENTIRIYDRKMEFDQVIWELAEALHREGYLDDTKSYVEDVLQREINYPTYVGDWFMIPHPLMNFAKKDAIGVAVLKKPIHVHGKEIQLIFLLAMEQKQNDQIGILFQFFKHMAMEKTSIGMLSAIETEQEFVDDLIRISDSTDIF